MGRVYKNEYNTWLSSRRFVPNKLIWFSDAVLLFVVEWRQNTVFCRQAIEHRAPRRRCHVSQRFRYSKCCSDWLQGLLFVTVTATRTFRDMFTSSDVTIWATSRITFLETTLRDKLLERQPTVRARSLPPFNNDMQPYQLRRTSKSY